MNCNLIFALETQVMIYVQNLIYHVHLCNIHNKHISKKYDRKITGTSTSNFENINKWSSPPPPNWHSKLHGWGHQRPKCSRMCCIRRSLAWWFAALVGWKQSGCWGEISQLTVTELKKITYTFLQSLWKVRQNGKRQKKREILKLALRISCGALQICDIIHVQHPWIVNSVLKEWS